MGLSKGANTLSSVSGVTVGFTSATTTIGQSFSSLLLKRVTTITGWSAGSATTKVQMCNQDSSNSYDWFDLATFTPGAANIANDSEFLQINNIFILFPCFRVVTTMGTLTLTEVITIFND